MRRSSETAPSFVSGTLKSTRTSTLRPLRSRSRIVCLDNAVILTRRWCPPRATWAGRRLRFRSAELRDLGDQVGRAARVAPLVVVPGDGLDEVAADDQRLIGREDARVRVADDVA